MDPISVGARARAVLAGGSCASGDPVVTRMIVDAVLDAHRDAVRGRRPHHDLHRDFERWLSRDRDGPLDALRRRRSHDPAAGRLWSQPEFLLLAYALESNLPIDRFWPDEAPREMLHEAIRAVFEEELGDEWDELSAALAMLARS